VSDSPRIIHMRSGTARRNLWFVHMNFASSMTGCPDKLQQEADAGNAVHPTASRAAPDPPLTDARQLDILRSSPTRLGAHELHRLQRRDLITLLAGTTVLSPFTARAQQQDRMRRVGVIMGFAEEDEVWQAYLATFRQRLQDFGWTDGRNIRFDYRFTGENTERMRMAAAEMVAIAPDVIFLSTNPVLSALSQLTRCRRCCGPTMRPLNNWDRRGWPSSGKRHQLTCGRRNLPL